MKIDFYEIDEIKLISYFCFVTQVSNHDLRELNGFKVRNILSVCFNPKIRDLILEDIFNQNGNIISIETKDNLFRYLSPNEIDDLRNLLLNYLNYQIESSWYNYICKVLNKYSLNTIVVSSSIINIDGILKELKVLFPNSNFSDWRNINASNSTLFLDYNQSWKKRNIFNHQENNSKSIFLKHFFENVYKRRIYNDEKQLFKSINTTLRKKLFGDEIITGLKDNLEKIKPLKSYNEWDLLHDSDDKYYYNPQEEIVIFNDFNKSNKYRINAMFILFREGKYSIENAKDMVLNPSKYENHFHYSHLDNEIDDIDLNELNKAIEKDESINMIIQPLWERFKLNENDGRLWKQLLQKKVQVNGLSNVYSEIESISKMKNFVSLSTFEKTYCNPSSDTIIPREKRVFKAICRYLELPLEYRVALHRERILIGGHSQELHIKLKPVIEAIVEFGVLDNHHSDDKLLEILNEVIDKIEEKVDMDYFGFTRDSLLYACIALCYDIIKKMRLKPIRKIEYITLN